MIRIVFLLAVACGAAACSSQPQITGAPPPGISYRFQGDNMTEANQRAEKYCGDYGKHAKLQKVEHGGADNIAVYECN